jgi:hypothetical protein
MPVKGGRAMATTPRVRPEIRAFMRCCDVLFNGTPFIPLTADEQELMVVYLNRLKEKFSI